MKINPKLQKNVFFDVSKFPADWGILLFPISMNRADMSQSSKECVIT